jgi:NAD(P)-dependent dehydrogenase (short-subunit alcohol dehydrogenase family)
LARFRHSRVSERHPQLASGQRAPTTGAAAEAVAEQISRAGGKAAASTESVASFAGGEAIVAAAVAAFGRLDILVNCAGNFAPTNIPNLDEETWDSILSVHLTGHLGACRAAAAQMLRQRGPGRIVTVSSRGAFFSAVAAYSSAKAGVMGLTAALAAELSGSGITVNCLLPSAMTQLFPAEASTRVLGAMPTSLDMDPEAMAPTVAWLCSDEAAGLTGRYFFSAGGDIGLLPQPLAVTGISTFVRKIGRWSADEIESAIPELLS